MIDWVAFKEEVYSWQFQSLGSPWSKCWQIQCLVRACSGSTDGCLCTAFSRGTGGWPALWGLLIPVMRALPHNLLLLLLSRFSRVRLCETPWTAAYQAPPPMGFARQEYWRRLPLPSLPHNLSTSERSYIQIPSLWGLDINMNFRGTQIFSLQQECYNIFTVRTFLNLAMS